MLDNLSENDMLLLRAKYGLDYKNPKQERAWTEEEAKYVYNSLRTSNRSNIQIFFFLLNNEIANEEPNLCQYLDIVLNETDEKILSSLGYELVEEEKYIRNTPKLIDTFYKRINITYSNSSQISENIKKMLILIFSYEPLEWYQTKSGGLIEFDDLLYDAGI